MLCIAYKIYTEILRSKMEAQVDEEEMLPESQTGFRKRKSTIDNVFVLNHLAQRHKGSDGNKEKIYTLFADLKAAFDRVNRKRLWKI